MKQNLIEEILRFNLLSKYDNSKTLSEQGSADINVDRKNREQLSQAAPVDSFVQKFYYDGASGAGTDEKDMRDAIATINSATQFWEKNNLVKTTSGMDIAGVINDELGSNNTWSLQVIVNHLKKIGIDSTFNKDSEGNYVEGSFKISTKPAAAGTTTVKFAKFPCVPKHPKAKEIKLSDGTSAYDINGVKYFGGGRKQLANKKMANFTCNDLEFKFVNFPCVLKHPKAKEIKLSDGSSKYQINGVDYYGNGRKMLTNGTMTNFTCNDPEFKTKTAVKPAAIPTELKDVNGVKAFQDWLDVNAKGWAKGYKDGIINKGQNGGGYGNFGDRTQKAWNNPAYKDQYLKSLTTPTATSGATETTGYEEYSSAEETTPVEQPATTQTTNIPKYGESYMATDGVVYNWNGTQYVAES